MPSLRPMAVSNATPTHTPSAKRGLPTYLTVHKHPRTDTTSPTLGVAIHARTRNTKRVAERDFLFRVDRDGCRPDFQNSDNVVRTGDGRGGGGAKCCSSLRPGP